MVTRMTPEYTATYNLPTIYRGDTMDDFTIKLNMPDRGQPIVPTSVCVQLMDERGRIAATLGTQISSDGLVTVKGLSASETAALKPQVYRYDVEYTLPGGHVRTYLTGTREILEDVSRCHAP